MRLTRRLETAGQGVDDDTAGIKVQTRYGYSPPWSYQVVSNPYRTVGDATMGWTMTATDSQHRYSLLLHSPGVSPPSAPSAKTGCTLGATPVWTAGSQASCVDGNQTQTLDEAGVSRTNTVDALGRLTQVVETGIAATTGYTYDVQGNLTSVTQAGTSGRSFAYDSLGRLQSATNPESGTTFYCAVVSGACAAGSTGYDGNGNLLKRTDARLAVTTMSYDKLNRLTGKRHAGAAAPLGRRACCFTILGGNTEKLTRWLTR